MPSLAMKGSPPMRSLWLISWSSSFEAQGVSRRSTPEALRHPGRNRPAFFWRKRRVRTGPRKPDCNTAGTVQPRIAARNRLQWGTAGRSVDEHAIRRAVRCENIARVDRDRQRRNVLADDD